MTSPAEVQVAVDYGGVREQRAESSHFPVGGDEEAESADLLQNSPPQGKPQEAHLSGDYGGKDSDGRRQAHGAVGDGGQPQPLGAGVDVIKRRLFVTDAPAKH